MNTMHRLTPIMLALTLSACGGSGGLFDSGPHVRGRVASILPTPGVDDVREFVRIVGDTSSHTPYRTADVGITEETEITMVTGADHVRVPIDSIRVGQLVEATFTGSVESSTPVRAKASNLTILEPRTR